MRGVEGWVVGVVLVAGCAQPPSLRLEDWVRDDGSAVHLPAHPDLPDRPLTHRLRCRVELPPSLREGPLELSVPFLPARATLRADGARAVLVEGDLDHYRSRGPVRWRIPDAALEDGALELELELEHRWRGSGRLDVVPRLLPAHRDDPASSRARVFHLHLAIAALVALAQVGLTCVAIFLVDRRRKSYLWFGIQALFASYYPLHVAGLTAAMGTLDLPLLPTTLIGATHVGLLFTHSYFALPPPSRLFWISGLGGPVGAWILWFWLGPFAAVDWIAPALVALVSLTIAYQLVTCARLVRRGRDASGAALLFTCWAAVALTSWGDYGGWLGIGEPLEGTHPATLGLALFALFLSLLLGRGHMRSLARADELNLALQAQVDVLETRGAEIERLNVELLRQLDERSAQILSALAASVETEVALPELSEGQLLRGRYRVLRPLGSGGMGSIYEVERQSDGARLAVKVAQEVRGRALARLAREAQLACRVSHANVVRVHDVDVAEPGFVFVVMELVEGETLAELARSRRPVSLWLDVLAQIADGLDALHEAGIVHRDLKPANVLVRTNGDRPHVTLVDLGISRMLDDPAEVEEDTRVEVPSGRPAAEGRELPSIVRALGQSREAITDDAPQPPRRRTGGLAAPLTRPGGVPGTPPYLAPELLLPNAPITPAADVFSFGVLAYQLLTGVRPYAEPAAFAVLEGREVPTPPPITDGCPELDAALAALLVRCVAVAPEDRPTPRALAAALRSAAA